MKKSFIVLASLAALAMAATSAFATQHEPPDIKFVIASASPDPGFQKTHLRCLFQDPCGVSNKVFLQALGGHSGSLYSFKERGTDEKPPPDNSLKKAGQFTPGGHYVVGAQLLPTWDGRVHS